MQGRISYLLYHNKLRMKLELLFSLVVISCLLVSSFFSHKNIPVNKISSEIKYIVKSILIIILVTISFNIQAQYDKLVWADEFNHTGLPDSTKWSYDTGGHGWGNNEKQYYTQKRPENASVKNGVLSITAIKETFAGASYTSARLVSKNKGDWKYGRFEIKAKMPKGRGLWRHLDVAHRLEIWQLAGKWRNRYHGTCGLFT